MKSDSNKVLNTLINKVQIITGVDIRVKSRKRDVIYAKKIYYSIARQKGYTYDKIGSLLGADHATVLWHCADTPYLLKQDEHFMNNYLRVQGKPTNGKCERDFFDMAIALHTKK